MGSSPSSYRVEFAASAIREFGKLPDNVKRRLAPKITDLGRDPHPPGLKKIVGGAGALRIRVGDYRVIYDVVDSTRTVLIRYVRHRRDAYR
jgi:mRNA interferase RelE/StbE